MNSPFDRAERTYYVDDVRLAAFQALTPEQRLRWVEELAAFIRLTKFGREQLDPTSHVETHR